MRKTENIPDTVRRLLSDYKGGSMDPIWSEIIEMVDQEMIGEYETINNQETIESRVEYAMAARNGMRKMQRDQLRSVNDTSADAAVADFIALVIDDYRISISIPEDDQIRPMSLDDAAERIISVIELSLLPNGRVAVSGKDSSEMAAALAPLFSRQLELLGANVDMIKGGAK